MTLIIIRMQQKRIIIPLLSVYATNDGHPRRSFTSIFVEYLKRYEPFFFQDNSNTYILTNISGLFYFYTEEKITQMK